MLTRHYPESAPGEGFVGKNDLAVILTIGSVRIGIESLGDPGQDRQKKSLQLFVERGCAVIVCASRTSGATADRVNELEAHGYTIVPRLRNREASHDAQEAANRTEADWMLRRVGPVIDAARGDVQPALVIAPA